MFGSASSLQRQEFEEVEFYAKKQARELAVLKSGTTKITYDLDQMAGDLQATITAVSEMSERLGICASEVRGGILFAT